MDAVRKAEAALHDEPYRMAEYYLEKAGYNAADVVEDHFPHPMAMDARLKFAVEQIRNCEAAIRSILKEMDA